MDTSGFRVYARRMLGRETNFERLSRSGVISVGRHTYGIPEVLQWAGQGSLEIGSFCSISSNVVILTGGNHRMDWTSTFPFSDFGASFPLAAGIPGHPQTRGPVVIGNDVWIGHGAKILSGVTVGDGAVVGASSVVACNVPPYGVVSGNPATVRRSRFPPETVERLLALKWWEWPDSVISRHVELLMQPPSASLFGLVSGTGGSSEKLGG